MTATETTPTEVPAWLADMSFCHIVRDDRSTYCGEPPTEGDVPTHVGSSGQAICGGCGRPACPRCAQLFLIEYMLERA